MDELVDILSQKIEKLDGVKVKKSAKKISYTHNLPFAVINIKKNHLDLEFTTPSKIKHTRLKKIKALKANKFRHSIVIKKESDIDPQVSGWLMIAHATN